MTQKLCKRFGFESWNRSTLTFSDSDKIHLNSQTNKVQLKEQSINRLTGNPVYPLDTDLTVTTEVSNPLAVRQWLKFSVNPRPDEQPEGTSIRYKLNDGTSDYYWDGGAWSIAGATDWNTEEEISDNIQSFQVIDRKLGIVANLLTTDASQTPTLRSIKVLMNCDIHYLKSIVSESLVPKLRESIRPQIDFKLRSEGSVYINFADFETEYNIVSITAAYNETDDPDHSDNLLASYDTAREVVTLASAVTRGKVVLLKLVVEPEVYVNYGSQDYIEVEKVPAIVVETITKSGNEVSGTLAVPDYSTKTAVVRRSPFRLSLSFDVRLVAEKTATLFAMMDEVLEFGANNRLLTWRDLDSEISMTIVEEGVTQNRPSLTDKHEALFTLRLDDIYLWLRAEETLYFIQNFNLTISSPELEGGVRWLR